ncbi:hypothetical protein PI124_g21300 [Phytophthora idaei]|nr:hypothetical protein PI125_g16390 [Phytophthora idaei]KAG3134328.1 hypothetical protein PI126_g18736 [Phytophthora idaei]KAG3233628.1 hypothetical protein PI124_g21300 [Phytophthora idaei]
MADDTNESTPAGFRAQWHRIVPVNQRLYVGITWKDWGELVKLASGITWEGFEDANLGLTSPASRK